MVLYKTMDKWILCVVALILGMLMFHMLKGVCGCKVVEGNVIGSLAGVKKLECGSEWESGYACPSKCPKTNCNGKKYCMDPAECIQKVPEKKMNSKCGTNWDGTNESSSAECTYYGNKRKWCKPGVCGSQRCPDGQVCQRAISQGSGDKGEDQCLNNFECTRL
jgi:hypothetical protein